MNYNHPQLQTALAAEYVLGTLTGQARKRFEKLMKVHPEIEAAVALWEEQLNDLNAVGGPVVPPKHVFRMIESRLFSDQEKKGNKGFLNLWKVFAFGVATLSIVIAVVMFNFQFGSQPALDNSYYTSSFKNDQKMVIWTVDINLSTDQLSINAKNVPEIQANKDYQLWLLPDNNQAPISLGLMPVNKSVTRPAATLAYGRATGIAVSLEPKGGSLTGAPTGPVLYTSKLKLRS